MIHNHLTNNDFTNSWCLKLNNSQVEEEFERSQNEKLKKNNPYFTLLTLLISIIDTTFTSILKPTLEASKATWLPLTSTLSPIILGISITMTILVFFVKKIKVQKLINYTNYLIMTSPFFITRFILLECFQLERDPWVSLILLEFFIRMLWLLQTMFLFKEVLIMHIGIVTAITFSSPFVHDILDVNAFNLPYTLFLLLMIFISYYYTKEVKIKFLSIFYILKKKKWFSNILENMNSGMIHLKNNKINYLNKIMFEKMLGNKDILNLIESYNISNNNLNIEKENINFIDNNENTIKNIPKFEDFLSITDSEPISEKFLDILLCNIRKDLNQTNQGNIFNSHVFLNQQINPDKINLNIIMENDSNQNRIFSSKTFLNELKKCLHNETNLNDFYNTNNKSSNKHTNLIFHTEKFVLLGQKDFEVEIEENGQVNKETLNLEIFIKFYCDTDFNDGSENFEIIFNDVTRTKMIEEKNAEFKYKSLFLAKIAHEFKNPLICITELVEQVSDDVKEKKSEKEKLKIKFNNDLKQIQKLEEIDLNFDNNLNNHLPLIKALSNYLLILVKDLDFFSQNQLSNNNKDSKNDYGEANLEEILQFCSEISKGLLKKNNKENEIDLIITKNENVPDGIWTDETKLKQILINLLSNAIKFTQKGKIKVDVSKEKEDFLKFEVTDSGAGMTDEVRENLFQPYKKSQDKNNKVGAGLGLSIFSDLVKKLGGTIDFSSKLNEGTKFSFEIPYLRPNEYLNVLVNKSIHFIKKTQSDFNLVKNIFKLNSNSSVLPRDENHLYSLLIPNKLRSVSNTSFLPTLEIFRNNNSKCDTVRIDSSIEITNTDRAEIYIDSKLKHSKFLSCDNFIPTNNEGGFPQISIDSSNPTLVIYNNIEDINSNYPINEDEINYSSKFGLIEEIDYKVSNKDKESKKIVRERAIKENSVKENLKINDNKKRKNSIKSIKEKEFIDNDSYNFIIADDEPLARQSTIRNFKKAANKSNKKITILESEDGVETLNIVYRSIIKGIKISGIITDETMRVLKGSNFVEVIDKLFEIKLDIPIYLVSAYEDNRMIKNSNLFKEIFSKPLEIKSALKIIELI